MFFRQRRQTTHTGRVVCASLSDCDTGQRRRFAEHTGLELKHVGVTLPIRQAWAVTGWRPSRCGAAAAALKIRFR